MNINNKEDNQEKVQAVLEDSSALTKRERKLQRRAEKELARQKEKKRQQLRRVLLWGGAMVVVVLVLGGIWLRSSGQDKTMGSDGGAVNGLTVSDGEHIKGNREAKVMLIEYADFQCPACASYSGTVRRLSDEYGDRVGFVFRYFPLSQIHNYAKVTAYAAEAAGRQGKFWEMHDMLFERQKDWSKSNNIKADLAAYAGELGLDVDLFKQDIEKDEVKKVVDDSYKNAIQLRLNATPTFFLNGKKLESLRSYEQFKQAVDDALVESDTQ